ncbi:serine/threonine protein kinase [Paraburkholderia terricola]|uniref:BREX system serine/threonine kinase PglW n=1 Tax=Paraburkholderia terricola TaxID=169427 RepID=UPI0028641620|nr:BREX system serine/threonine kinase PglW [Paraburkholderia terricola]MDR6495646.1 serine/threonine protein kinase [Paraburkholderia terricola]
MPMSSSRWQAVAPSQFTWEREALDWLRNHLPDREPWHVWSNFEFIDEEGKVNEVDALILTPSGLFLVEIKSRPGVVAGDAHTWSWVTDGRERAYDNPLILANRKSKRLASLLRRQSSAQKAKVRLPFVEPLIFLSATSLTCKLTGTARAGIYLRGQPNSESDVGIIGVLHNGTGSVRDTQPSHVDQQHARVLARAMAEAGIRPSNKYRKVGDYQLGALLSEGASYQDWEGTHTAMDSVRRRVRIYTIAAAASADARNSLVRQAQREFQILEGIDHLGIVKVKDYQDTELGPALIFDHDAKAIRLDFLLREMGQLLSVDQRLQIVRDLAETLKYAHQKRLYHRALCPQSVLVQDVAGATPRPRIMNWQTGTREGTQNSDTVDPARRTVGGTMHVDEYVEDPGLVYLAPETSQAEVQHGPSLDVFSLGAITYHVFSGRPPAGSVLELAEKLRVGQGLRLSDVMDGCGKQLQDLIQYSTSPDVMGRYGSIDEFLQDLDKVVDELTTPEPEATVDPAEARPEERIEGGFTVIRRMGRGSSADVLLVRPDDGTEEMVLKVALDASHNDRITAEGEALKKLRHPNIVEWQRTLAVNGRTALLMRKAGDTTLAHRIREEARLSLDLLQRFGEELIQAVDYLEQQGVAHRDIKPGNIGMSQVGSKGKLQLVLFDFSLTRTSPENISAGTHPYLDPFLSLRKPPRWDLYAERFALGVTLHEMVTGALPRWGDGKTQPSMLDCEATLAVERFDPLLRDGFSAFFAKALSRNPRGRFDNAEEMLRAWRQIFEAGASGSQQSPDPFEAVARVATADTTMAELGYSVEAQNVLEAMAIHNARELLAVDRVRFRYLRGVGDRIRKEIGLKATALAAIRPDLVQGRPTLHEADAESASAGATSVNELAAQLLPRRPAGDGRAEEAALAIYLGLEEAEGSTLWTPLGVAANAISLDRSAVSSALLRARERWLKTPRLTELRNHFESLLSTQGGVMTVSEMASALLAMRGCASQEDAERMRLATAVVRACCEAEAQLERQRFQEFEHLPLPVIAISAELAEYARRLGASADACAQAEPLLTPQRALETLESVPAPAANPALSAQRLLRLSTASSQRAALSSRQEIYPRGMAASLALRQSLGALMGVRFLRVKDVQDRVAGRYPEALPLPPRPLLDTLLGDAGALLVWSDDAPAGPGYVPSTQALGPSVGTTTQYSRATTASGQPGSDLGIDETLEPSIEAQKLEDRLAYAQKAGGFLVLTVEPRLAYRVEAELLRRFGRQRASFDALILKALRQQADALKVDWNLVLRADGAAATSSDWGRLMRLVQKAVPQIKQALLDATAPVLLVNSGLIARYGLMQLIDELRDEVGRPGKLSSLWMLLPMAATGLPTIDDVPVPVITSTQWASVPVAWAKNLHRAAAAV